MLAEQRRNRWDTPERRHSWIESDRDLQCPACHRIHAGECAATADEARLALSVLVDDGAVDEAAAYVHEVQS
jgi:hypothetical protein